MESWGLRQLNSSLANAVGFLGSEGCGNPRGQQGLLQSLV